MSEDKKLNLGFIGMGTMGSHMAQQLLGAGYPLTVYDRTPDKARVLESDGARVAGSPRELAVQVEIVLASVTDDAAQEQVMFGPDGALAGVGEGSTLVDLSTVSPAASRRLYQAAHEKGATMIDAPVAGSVPQVEQGSLAVFVGGDEAAYNRCREVLAVLGTTYYMGPSGMGTTMKLVVNTLLGLGMQALAEAIALGEKAGLPQEQLLDVLGEMATLSAGQKAKLANVRRGEYPTNFSLALMHKDLGLILDQAAEVSVPMPATAVAQQMCAAALARGMDADFSVIVRFMQALAGMTE